MNKLFVTAIAAISLLGLGGVASAQSTVTMYGAVDAGIVYDNGGYADGSVLKLESGMESGSRVGFKGTEELGNGMQALFVLEEGVAIDTGRMSGHHLFGRQAFIGLSGGFGTVTAGRQYTPIYSAYGLIDPFGTNTAGDINTLFGRDSDFIFRDSRMSNSIMYVSPNLNGITATLGYSFGEQAGSISRQSQKGLSLGYANDGLNIIYGYHNANSAHSITNASPFITHFVGGSYNFNVVKVHAAADRVIHGNHKTQSYLLGATYPIGLHSIFADYIYRDNKTESKADISQIAVGYNHGLSRRTNFYAIIAYTMNESNAMSKTAMPGRNVTQIQLGVRHLF